MRIARHASCSVVVAIMVFACARTSINSMRAPEVQGKTFRNILVFAALADLGLRQQMEDRVARHSSEGIVRFVPSYRMFFPGKQYTKEEMASVLSEYRIDAALVLSPGQTGSTTSYVPPTYTTGCSMWNSVSGCTQATTTTTGGYNYNKPWAQFTAQLYETMSGTSVWVATATTGGNAFAGSGDLVNSMADKTAKRLQADLIIPCCIK